ncbi:MAG: SOS response-associated peptidase family protein [Chitinophagaceae bacterium]|nr:SOS response-associated peptidase family protein [Chitinophagaceae bacterium]
MCYYNGQKVTHAEFIRLKGIEKLVASYGFLSTDLHDGFAYGNIAVLKPIVGQKDFEIVQMEWGFIPDTWFGKPLDTREKVEQWRRGYKNAQGKFIPGITTLNAMSEELLLPGKIYRDSALNRRCLILSSGFFEWRHHCPANKRTGEPVKTALKIPHYITVKDQPYFFMSGEYKPWTDKATGETIDTVTINTTAAPEGHLMAKVHNSKMRMPSILNEDLAWEWMFEPLTESRITEISGTQFPSDQMTACTIAKDFKEQLDPAKPFLYEDLPMIESVL